MNVELSEWLGLVTHRLPKTVVENVRDELACHYDDAYDDYLLQGYDVTDAHHMAMRDLGDAGITAKALEAIHLTQYYYKQAMVMSMLPSLSIMVFALPVILLQAWLNAHGMAALFYIISGALFGATLYSTYVVMRGLRAIVGGSGIVTPSRLIQWGLAALFVPSLISNVLIVKTSVSPDVHLMLINDPSVVYYQFYSSVTMVGQLYEWIIVAGVLVVGVGWLMLATRISHLAGYEQIVRFLMSVSGFLIIVQALALLTHDVLVSTSVVALVSIVGVVKFAALAIMFYRAAYKGAFDDFSYSV